MANLLPELQQQRQPVNLLAELQPATQELRIGQAATPVSQDFIPTEEALAIPAQGVPERTISEKIIGVGDAGLSVLTSATSGAVGFGLGSLQGVLGELTGRLKTGEGLEEAQALAAKLTFEPRTEAGKDILKSVIEPLSVLPPVGFGGLRPGTIKKSTGLSSNAKKALEQAAPTIEQIKSKASGLYRELDKSGVRVRQEVFSKFVSDLNKQLDRSGFDVDLHPDSAAAIRRLNKDVGTSKSFSDLNILRQIASDAAGAIKPKDARIGNIILNKLDEGIDKLAESAGRDSKGARQLWRRAKVAESIAGMVEDAGLAASGLENGLRIEARKILRSKKKMRGFSKSELNSLRELDKGSTAANAAKFLGKFGISEGKATSMLGTAIGGQIGNQLGGLPGAAAAVTLGQIAKQTAQKLTSGKAKFADQLVKAGGNGRAITQAYLRNTPKSKRSVSDLTQLLLDPKITPESISKLNFKIKIVDDAKFFADKIKAKSKNLAATAIDTQPIATTLAIAQQEKDQ